MKKNYILSLIFMMISLLGYSQTSTETFETEAGGNTSFTDNEVEFNIKSNVGTFKVQANYPNTGWSGTGSDNKYIDNTNSLGSNQSFSIKTTSNLFKVNRFWMYLSNSTLDLTASGTLTVTGKLNGDTKFSQIKSNGFTTSMQSYNGFTLIDLTNLNGQNFSNIVIDELVLTLGGNYGYASLDAFTWVKDSNYVSGSPSISLIKQYNVSCNTGTNGALEVSASGGMAPYTYSWSPSGGTNATATGLAAGNYTITVKGSDGLRRSETYTITQPAELTATISKTDVSCNGGANGTASVTVTGGTPSYTYSWLPSGGTAATATGLTAGTYTCTITDANACSITRSVTITQPTAVPSPTGDAEQSFNLNDTLAALVVNGQNVKWYATQADAQAHVNALANSTVIVNNTTYYATQTVGQCESSTALAVKAYNATLAVGDSNKTKAIQLYPNPVRDILILKTDEKIISVDVFGIDGKKLINKVRVTTNNQLDVHNLVQGAYIIQVTTETKTETIKFIKQ